MNSHPGSMWARGRRRNEVRGHNTDLGYATIAEINAKYGCTHTMDKADFQVPAVLYRLNPYDHNWTDAEVYDRIKCCWPAAKWRRDRVQVACAVSDHVIRAVFRIDPNRWHEVKAGYWGFERLSIDGSDPALGWVRGNVRTRPPCRLIIRRTYARPMPVPGTCRWHSVTSRKTNGLIQVDPTRYWLIVSAADFVTPSNKAEIFAVVADLTL